MRPGSICDRSLPGLSACTCIVNDASSIDQGVSKAIGDAAGREAILAEAGELMRKFHLNVDAWLQGPDEAAAAAAAAKPVPVCPHGDQCLHLVLKGKWDKLPQALKDASECHNGRHTRQQLDAAAQAHAGGAAAAVNTTGKCAYGDKCKYLTDAAEWAKLSKNNKTKTFRCADGSHSKAQFELARQKFEKKLKKKEQQEHSGLPQVRGAVRACEMGDG